MRTLSIKHLPIYALSFSLVLSTASYGLAGALAKPINERSTTTGSTSAAETAKLSGITAVANAAISKRLVTLSSLTPQLTSIGQVSAADQTKLSDEVSNTRTGLTNLQVKLAADTDLTTAKADATSVVQDYRVYALLVPKIALVRAADNQQATEAKLSALADKLQSRLTSSTSTAGSSALLAVMQAKIVAAQAISSKVEATVIGLQPADYNSNHAVLSGQAAQLKIAHSDNAAAIAAAKQIVASLK